MSNQNKILTAVLSKLISDRDNVLAQLDLIVNKNISTEGVKGIVNETAELFTKLSTLDSSIESVELTIKNSLTNNFEAEVQRLREALVEMQEEKNNNNNNKT